MLGIWSMGKFLVHPFSLPSHFLPPPTAGCPGGQCWEESPVDQALPCECVGEAIVRRRWGGREEGGVSCGCE